MKTFNGSSGFFLTAGLLILFTFFIFYEIFFEDLTIKKSGELVGQRPFELSLQNISSLDAEVQNGNCASAYKLGRYHLYSSLDLQQAEKYFRLGVKCQDADALVGLITVLRKPENDAEIDKLIIQLKHVDFEKGKSATEEVALRREERSLK